MEIRKATMDDMQSLIDLRVEFIQEMHPSLTPQEVAAHADVLRDYFQRHLNLDFWGYFAEIEGEIAAVTHLVLHERPANPRLKSGKLAMILNVYTKPTYRKRGLASLLLKDAIKDASNLGASIIELQASEMGKRVYEQLGFEVHKSEYTPMVYHIHPISDVSAAKS